MPIPTFAAESGSLRSFRGTVTRSRPPSPKASSVRGRRSFTLPIPGLRRFGATETAGMRVKPEDLNSPSEFGMREKPAIEMAPKGAPDKASQVDAKIRHDDPAPPPPPPPPPESRPRSKSRGLIRRITTKLRARSPPAPPPAIASAFNKESRDAALRERGLLPPLRPNRDLSAQEMEQDQRIPVVTPTSDEADEGTCETAADLIKQQWEAKNRSMVAPERARMDAFKFGGSSPALSIPEGSNLGLEPLTEVDTPLPSPSSPQAPRDATGPALVPSLRSGRSPRPAALELEDARASTPLSGRGSVSDRDFDPYRIPLPPSPLPSVLGRSSIEQRLSADWSHSQLFPTSIPLPPSPLPSTPGTPKSVKSTRSGMRTPRPLDVSPAPAFVITPLISLSPPASPTSQGDSTTQEDDEGLLASHSRESNISNATPSLDSSSRTISTMSTTESTPSVGRGRSPARRVQEHGLNYIPMIIEGEEASATPPADQISTASGFQDEADGELPAPFPLPKKAPAASGDLSRKKSLNPFKRSRTPDPSDSQTKKVNMLRSVVGTLSRPKAKPKTPLNITAPKRTFNASHLPASPVSPKSFGRQQTSPTSPTLRTSVFAARTSAEAPHTRLAVSPTLYSRGSILMETNGIEDEETRRMTELAFLG